MLATQSAFFTHLQCLRTLLEQKAKNPKQETVDIGGRDFRGDPRLGFGGLGGGSLACSESGRVTIMDWCMYPSTKTEFSSEECYSLSLSRAQYLQELRDNRHRISACQPKAEIA